MDKGLITRMELLEQRIDLVNTRIDTLYKRIDLTDVHNEKLIDLLDKRINISNQLIYLLK